MASISTLSLMLGLVLGVVLTFGGAWMHYGPQLRHLRKRSDQLSSTLAQTNEMLMQARKQTEAVQKELENARRNRTVPQATAVRLTEPRPSHASVMINSAFADTLMQAPPQPTKPA
jgi:F0F1-type ATP synthase membrane subunit b/b'